MRGYALRRLGQAALTLLGVSVLVFVVLRVLPGDPAKMLLPEGAPQSAVDELNRHLGLREPLHVQYAIFIRSVSRGDFGQSFQYRAPALQVVTERLAATAQLRLHPSKTSGDYARELRTRGSPAHAEFGRFGRRYDHVLFGTGTCDAETYTALREHARGVIHTEARAA